MSNDYQYTHPIKEAWKFTKDMANADWGLVSDEFRKKNPMVSMLVPNTPLSVLGAATAVATEMGPLMAAANAARGTTLASKVYPYVYGGSKLAWDAAMEGMGQHFTGNVAIDAIGALGERMVNNELKGNPYEIMVENGDISLPRATVDDDTSLGELIETPVEEYNPYQNIQSDRDDELYNQYNIVPQEEEENDDDTYFQEKLLGDAVGLGVWKGYEKGADFIYPYVAPYVKASLTKLFPSFMETVSKF